MVKVKKKTANLRFTARMEKFCHEYLIDLNATQAAIRAGYSAKTAAQQGERLLRKVDIAGQVTKAQAERSKRTEDSQDAVIADLLRLLDGAETAEQFAAAIRAAELRGKHLGMFLERSETKSEVTLKGELVAKLEAEGLGLDAITDAIKGLAGRS